MGINIFYKMERTYPIGVLVYDKGGDNCVFQWYGDESVIIEKMAKKWTEDGLIENGFDKARYQDFDNGERNWLIFGLIWHYYGFILKKGFHYLINITWIL